MSKKKIYTLMYKDFEVLTFNVDLRKRRFAFLNKCEHFDKAPYGFDKPNVDLNQRLTRFFNSRMIPVQRFGSDQILKATHSKNFLSLSFKGHGLSLSNHYWIKKGNEKLKYKDINFFENKWDDSFARALLRDDFDALSHVDLNVPDIVTGGWGTKGWLYDEKKGPRLYKLGIDKDHPEEVLGEVLACNLATRLLSEKEVLRYDLEKIYGKYASVSSPMINVDEELIPLTVVLSLELSNLYHLCGSDKNAREQFMNKLKEEGYNDLYLLFIKLNCLRSICFVNDLHFGNISIIRNMKTGEIRPAPIYDLGGSFGSGRTAKSLLSNPNSGTLLLIYFAYSILNPKWDYSWYDKTKLIGFEDEMRKILPLGEFYTPELVDFAVKIYAQQKESLDECAEESKRINK